MIIQGVAVGMYMTGNYRAEEPYKISGFGGIGSGSNMSVAPGALGTPSGSQPVPAAAQVASSFSAPSTTSAAGNASDIAARITQLTSKDSDWMRSARTEGLKQANRRGLANSSIGIGAARREAISAAAPIASQESQQAMQQDISRSQIAAQERGQLLDAFTQQVAGYQSSLSNTLNNDKIPAASRSAVQQSLRDQLTYGLNWMQNLYGVRVPNT